MAGLTRLEQVEALVVLSRVPELTLDGLTKSLGISSDAAESCVASLVELGFVERAGSLRISERHADLTDALIALGEQITRDRPAVVNAFYGLRLESLRAFSDAFRLRKDD